MAKFDAVRLGEILGVKTDPGTDPVGFIADLKARVGAVLAEIDTAPDEPVLEDDPPDEGYQTNCYHTEA